MHLSTRVIWAAYLILPAKIVLEQGRPNHYRFSEFTNNWNFASPSGSTSVWFRRCNQSLQVLNLNELLLQSRDSRSCDTQDIELALCRKLMPNLVSHQPARNNQLKGSLPWRIASLATLGTVGMLSKIFLIAGQRSSTQGLPEFLTLLENRTQPIITVSNHISVMDDPLLWGLMPAKTLFRSHTVRWALGSADICFTNRLMSTFFGLGQTLPTYRHGVGIFQPALDDAITLLHQSRAWLHVFPEGRIRQSKDLSMRYYKWGISRIVLETSVLCGQPPIIVPLFIEGFDKIMHESRTFPRFLPRLGKSIKCTYGRPIEAKEIQLFVDRWKHLCRENGIEASEVSVSGAHLPQELIDGTEAEEIRMALAKLIRDAVAKLRTDAGYPDEHPLAHDARFYDSQEGLKYDELSGIPRPDIFNSAQRKRKRDHKTEIYEKEGTT